MVDRDWAVESIRATFFVVGTPKLLPREWWTSVAGLDYPSLQVSEGPAGHASAQAEIESGTAALVLVCAPGRIDWHYAFGTDAKSPKLELTGGTPAIPILEAFIERVSRWMAVAPACTRVAIGAIIRGPTGNRHAGYELLRELLPAVSVDPVHSRDLMYRINRPRQSLSLPGVEIFRLGEWAVAQLSMQVPAPGRAAGVVAPIIASDHFCRVALDVNTSPDSQLTFQPEQLRTITDELMAGVIELMINGDRP